MPESNVRVFKPRSRANVARFWNYAFLICLTVVAPLVSIFSSAHPSSNAIAFCLTLPVVGIGVGFWMLSIDMSGRVELSDDGIRIYSSLNKLSFVAAWDEVTAYVRKSGLSLSVADVPCWEISTGKASVILPGLAQHLEFQREMFRRIPASAIPRAYFEHAAEPAPFLETPIRQFSLVVDNDGLVVDSDVSRARIKWKDLIYVEEVDYTTGQEPHSRVPRIYLATATDRFELTTFWKDYDRIRSLILAKAPPQAIVVKAW